MNSSYLPSVISNVNVGKCEYAIVEIENLNLRTRNSGIGIRSTVGSANFISNVNNTDSYKLTEGSFQLLEALANGCPYIYIDRYRITRYK